MASAPSSADLASTAAQALSRADPALTPAIDRHGPVDPFHWPGKCLVGDSLFGGLALHIVAQQISVAAALTIFPRLVVAVGGDVTATALAAADVADIRAVGLSGSKAVALRRLGERLSEGHLDLRALQALTDESVISQLTKERGLGPWSAQMFLLYQLHRPDVLPASDIGIREGMRLLDGSDHRPSVAQATRRALDWKPWRSYAAAYLWLIRADAQS